MEEKDMIMINLDVMMAKRKKGLTELAGAECTEE